jgi:hypothetical protein
VPSKEFRRRISGLPTRKARQKKIKKWIISGEDDKKAVLTFGGRPGKDMKMIIKALEKGMNEHFTMMIREDGFVDFHKTREGKTKLYTPLLKGTVDYWKIVEDIVSILLKQLKTPIDPKDQTYQEHIVLIPKSEEKRTDFYERFYIKGGKMILPSKKVSEKIVESIEDYFIIDYLPEISKYSFSLAYAVNPKEENIDYLVNVNNDYFLVGMNEKELDRILKKSFRIEWLRSEDQESTR